LAPRRNLSLLGALSFLSLVLAGACTDNEPTRDPGYVPPSAGAGGSQGGRSATGGTGGTGAGTGGSAGGAVVDACLPPCDDPAGCVLTPEQQLMVDACRIYAKRCPAQPPDVMTARQPDEEIPAGPTAPSTPTRPQLTEAVADDLYTIEEALRGGGVYTVAYSNTGDSGGAGGEAGGAGVHGGEGGEGGGPGGAPLGVRTVTYTSVDDWDPRGPIEDVSKIVPGIVVDPNGDPATDGTYKTIGSAINAAVVVAGCPRVFIKVLPGTYRGKVIVPAKTSSPPVTLYGVDRDPSKIVIVAGNSEAGSEDDGTPLTIHQSATFTNSLPQPFQARNLTIQNDYVAGTFVPENPEKQTAVALLSQADRALFDNVRILGHKHAVYVKSTGANEVSRAYFRNVYLEGDEDIILGRGAAVFDQSRIHSLGDRMSGGAITAASTRVDNPHGILIINSELTADARVSGVYLGHSWYEGDTEEAVGKTIVRNSILGAHVRSADPWAPTTRATPKHPTAAPTVLYTSDDYYARGTGLIPPEVLLAEFGNSGPGAAN
jgi:pectinesterase